MLSIFDAQTGDRVYCMDEKTGVVNGRIPNRTREAQATVDSIMAGDGGIRGYDLMLGEGIGELAEELSAQDRIKPPARASCISLDAGSIN